MTRPASSARSSPGEHARRTSSSTTSEFVAFLDVRPLFPGHVLLVPQGAPRDAVGPARRPARPAPASARSASASRCADAMGAKGVFTAMNNIVSQSRPAPARARRPAQPARTACAGSSGRARSTRPTTEAARSPESISEVAVRRRSGGRPHRAPTRAAGVTRAVQSCGVVRRRHAQSVCGRTLGLPLTIAIKDGALCCELYAGGRAARCINTTHCASRSRDARSPPYLDVMNRVGRERGWPPSGSASTRRSNRRARPQRRYAERSRKDLFMHELFGNSATSAR